MMQLNPYEECNHATIADWWEAHGATVIPHEALPAEGCIAYNDEDVPCAAAWLYLDNSCPVCILSWMIVNPDIHAFDKFEGLNHCVRFLTDRAESLNYGLVISMSAIPSVSRLMQPHGYEVVAQNVEVMLKG